MLWQNVEYEEEYHRAYSDGCEAEVRLARLFWTYSHVRPHSALGGKTPHEAYTKPKPCSSRPSLTMSGAEFVQLTPSNSIRRFTSALTAVAVTRHGSAPSSPRMWDREG
nr:integrase core domain-containing protein [Synechococcus sp. CCY 0621]